MSREILRRICVQSSILASLTVVMATVYSYAGPSDLSSVFGADLSACKGPCNDGGVSTQDECLDQTGPPCDTNFCSRNDRRTLACAVGAPGPEDKACKYTVDNNDWFRMVTVRRPPSGCTDGKQSTLPYGACTVNNSGLAGAQQTPCLATNGCATGPIQTQITYPGRLRCDNS